MYGSSKIINNRYKNAASNRELLYRFIPMTVRRFIIAALFISAFFLFSTELFSQTPEEVGIIVRDNLRLRSKPVADSQAITTMKKGTDVKILGREAGWLKIEYKGLVGFIRDSERLIHLITVSASDGRDYDEKGPGGKLDVLKQEAEELNRKIVKGEAEVETIRKKEKNIISSLNKIDYSLDRARRQIARNRTSLKTLNEMILNAAKQHKELTKRIEKNESYTSKRLVSLYKMSRIGKLGFFASADSMHEMFQRKRDLELILAHDEIVRRSLIKDKEKLKQLIDELSAKRRKKQDLESNIQGRIKEISDKKSARKKLLAQVRDKRSLEVAALNSLKMASKALDRTLQDFSNQSGRDGKPEMVSTNPFYEFKGLLKMPVRGKIVSLFGAYKDSRLNIKNFRSGIDIQAKRGTKIQTVFAGQILYADWFKGYGNMIIIDHGDSYYTVYAHLEELFKSKGNQVNALEDIGTLGDTGSMTGPKLHFEIRHHGKPLNPMDWLIK